MNKGPFVLRTWGRRLLWGRPTLYRHLGLARGRGDCFDEEFDLWIDGFPRSANTFTSEAFRLANPAARLIDHRHLPPFLVRWVRTERPGIFLIRKPDDAVISWAIVWGGYLEESLDYYIDFHRALLPYVSRLFVATFDMVTEDLGAVIGAFNVRFGTQYSPPPPGVEGTSEVFARIEQNSPLSGDEMTICRPSEKRVDLKQQLRQQLRENPVLIQKLEAATALYAAFTANALGRQQALRGAVAAAGPARGGANGTRSAQPALLGLGRSFSLTGRSANRTIASADLRVMMHYVAFRTRRFLLPLTFVGLALAFRLALEPALQGRHPYSLFYIAIVLTAWTCGTTETFLAVLLGFLGAQWFFIEPVRSLAVVGAPAWVGTATYFFVGLAVIWFMKSKQAARLLALSSAVEARRRQEALETQQSRAQRMEHKVELLTSVVEAAQVPLLSFNPAGHIETWNNAAEALFGFSAQEAIGQPLALLVPSEDKQLQQDLISGISGDGNAEPWEATLARKDGAAVKAWLTLSPLRSSSGKLLGAVVVARPSAS